MGLAGNLSGTWHFFTHAHFNICLYNRYPVCVRPVRGVCSIDTMHAHMLPEVCTNIISGAGAVIELGGLQVIEAEIAIYHDGGKENVDSNIQRYIAIIYIARAPPAN